MLPEVGKIYNFYDDGKITPSRHELVTITDVKKFSDVDEATKKIIREAQTHHTWLFKETTDYVVFGKTNLKLNNPNYIFIRAKDDGWFGCGNVMTDGRLDVDRSLTEQLSETLREGGTFQYDYSQFLNKIV